MSHRTADEIISEGNDAGKTAAQIQAELREGFDATQITTDQAIQSLALGQEELLGLTVKLFGESVKLVGAEVNVGSMFQAYLDSFRLAQDAFFYDLLNPAPEVEGEVVEGEAE